MVHVCNASGHAQFLKTFQLYVKKVNFDGRIVPEGTAARSLKTPLPSTLLPPYPSTPLPPYPPRHLHIHISPYMASPGYIWIYIYIYIYIYIAICTPSLSTVFFFNFLEDHFYPLFCFNFWRSHFFDIVLLFKLFEDPFLPTVCLFSFC